MKPPKEAIVLFDGKAEQMRDNRLPWHSTDPADWTVMTRAWRRQMKVTSSVRRSSATVTCMLSSCEPLEGDGNSGVGMQGRYEIQYSTPTARNLKPTNAGAFYDDTLPKVIASKPAGEWQTFDIFFRASAFRHERRGR